MGVAGWLAAGAAAFLIGRLIPAGRQAWWLEIAVALATSVLAGAIATALDFGGWGVFDWRAVSFACFVSFAAIGVARRVRSNRQSSGSGRATSDVSE